MKSIEHTPCDRRADLPITLALLIFSFFVAFYGLGGAALFEPTEGRNAEIAREILLTHDWVTPHDNFIPVLDKPIFFHWSIAVSYKLFGVSEWSARLPSALAGWGCVVLVYLLARKVLGLWEALWSGLILITSLQFFALSRIVIFDMPLTFFTTLSLCCFYRGAHCESRFQKRLSYLAMYAAMAVASLIKGPIGVFLPAMVIVPYIVISRKRFLLRELDLIPGVLLFLIIAAPWYIWADIRNPGYLRYFFWEENLVRFITPHFGRSEPAYYFIGVLAAGFFPWTFLLPYIIRAQRKRPISDATLFLLLAAVLPFLFFSFSHTKLSHYILPSYPPVAILAGEAVARGLRDRSPARKWPLWFPAVNLSLILMLLGVAFYRRDILPPPLDSAMGELYRELPGILILATVLGIIWLASSGLKSVAKSETVLYLYCCAGFALYFWCAQPIVMSVALASSSKIPAQKSAPLINPDDQLVLYNDFRSSLPYYLKIDRPLWFVWSGDGTSVMESWYILEKHVQPAAPYGKALITFEEFAKLRETTRKRLLVFLRKKHILQLTGGNAIPAKVLLDFGDYVLMSMDDAHRGSSGNLRLD